MKKQKRTVFLMVLAAFAFICTNFAACKNGSGDAGAQNGQEQTEVKTEIPVVSLKTIAIGEYSEQEKSAIIKIFPNSEFSTELSAVNESHKVVINDYEDLPDNIADDAYYILYEIQKNEIEDVVDDKDDEYWENVWNEENIANVKKELNICPYAFIGYNPNKNASLQTNLISTQEQFESVMKHFYDNQVVLPGEDAIPQPNSFEELFSPEGKTAAALEEDSENNKFIMWFSIVARWILRNEEDNTEALKASQNELSARLMDSSSVQQEQNDFNQANSFRIDKGNVYDNVSYKIPREDTNEYMTGSGSWLVSMLVTPMNVTGTSGCDGMYYVVKATIDISNEYMMHHNWTKNTKGGEYAAFYLKNFAVSFVPHFKTYGNNSKSLSNTFATNCFPSPKTATADVKNSYSTGFDFGIGGKGSYGTKDGKAEWSVEVSADAKWSWKNEKQWTTNDLEITESNKTIKNGAIETRPVKYVMEIGNLPYWDKSQKHYTRGPRICYADVDIDCCWVWYVPGNFSTHNPVATIDIIGTPTYGARWHWSDDASNEWVIGAKAHAGVPLGN